MSPVCDEAEQVIKLPNSYLDRGYRKGKKEGREELLQTIPISRFKSSVMLFYSGWRINSERLLFAGTAAPIPVFRHSRRVLRL